MCEGMGFCERGMLWVLTVAPVGCEPLRSHPIKSVATGVAVGQHRVDRFPPPDHPLQSVGGRVGVGVKGHGRT